MQRVAGDVKGKTLKDRLKQWACELGADRVGVSSIERWNDPPPFDAARINVYPHSGYLPTDLMPSALSVVVVAVRILDGVADAMTSPWRTTGVQGNFGYVHLNRLLNDITFGLARWLENLGYRTMPLGYNIGSRYNHKADEDPTIIGPAYGLFSLKRAAVLAGLGRKARNSLIASPELGTRMRLGAVLTAAELEESPLLEGDPCPSGCHVCARVCPGEAISRDGRVSHLRCFSDAGSRGTSFAKIKEEFKKRYPPDLPGVDYITNDFLAIDGKGNRYCRTACMAMCPLGEHKIPDVVRRAKNFHNVVPKAALHGFPAVHTFY